MMPRKTMQTVDISIVGANKLLVAVIELVGDWEGRTGSSRMIEMMDKESETGSGVFETGARGDKY